MEINGWSLKYDPLFNLILKELILTVKDLQKKDSNGFLKHPKTKLLAGIGKVIFEDVPENPNASRFWLSGTLAESYKHWLRAKKYLPDRYRLFFLFSSAGKTIIYAWINDENCLRKKGAKTDVYNMFEGLLDREKIKNHFDELNDSAQNETLLVPIK